jgi:hypothetical protein
VDVEKYYLNNIGLDINLSNDLIKERLETIELIKNLYKKEGNKVYQRPKETWTIRKVVRRFIWHDRIHGKAIERMEKRLSSIK